MPIYFGHPVPVLSKGKKPEVSPELKAKGIELLRCAPCDMNVIGVPVAQLPLWGIFSEHFSTISHALSETEDTSFNPDNLEIRMTHPNPLPLKLPQLCVSLREHRQEALEFLGNNHFEQAEIRGATFFLCHNVTRGLIQKIISPDCPAKLEENSFCPYRFVNLAAVYSALDIINLISYAIQSMGFTVTNKDLNRDDFDKDENMDEGVTIEQMETSSDGGVSAEKRKGSERHDLSNLFEDITLDSLMAQIPVGRVHPEVLSERTTFTPTDKPIIPGPGIVLRYVPELANEDKTTVLSFIQRYMLLNLGASMNDSLANYIELKSSWGNLCSTDFGLALSHLVKCLHLGMDTHTSVIPLFDMGYYEGCILQGNSFSISVNNSILRPLNTKNLSAEIESMSTHVNTLKRIIAIVNREIKGTEFSTEDVISMRAMRDKLLGIPLTEGAKDEIISTARNLRYPSRPWSVNHTDLMKMIEIIRSPATINDNTPLGPRSLFSKDWIVVALSCFGEITCPSFYHANGTAINLDGNLPRPSGDSNSGGDRRKGKQTTSNAAWTFAVRRVQYDEALGDLRRVLSKKEARSISSSIARGLGCVVISGKQFGELFASLSDLSKILSGSSDLQRMIENKKSSVPQDTDDIVPTGQPRVKRVKV